MSGISREELLRFAALTYGTEPEYLWESTPDAAVLRHSENRKWYAIIMRIPADRLGLESSERVDIVNVKCGAMMTGSLLMSHEQGAVGVPAARQQRRQRAGRGAPAAQLREHSRRAEGKTAEGTGLSGVFDVPRAIRRDADARISSTPNL